MPTLFGSGLQKIELTPIAIFKCDKKHPFEAARQASIDQSATIGQIQFQNGSNFEQALDDIEGFSHIWVIYQFHQNQSWKPKVSPPRGSSQKKGVFATRSPYRPNPIGMSCVQLVERKGLTLFVKNYDLLNETPILDIKPYLPYADSFPEAQIGWLDSNKEDDLEQKYSVETSELANQQFAFLESQGLSQIRNTIFQQLETEPLNSQKKRVKMISDDQGIFAYRTWRAQFQVSPGKKISIQELFSGYSQNDLNQLEDPYQDKGLHRNWMSFWKASLESNRK